MTNNSPRVNEVGKKLIIEALEKFPESPSLTLARKLFKEHPIVWSNVDSCRTTIRSMRGASGTYAREHKTNKKFFRELQKPNNPMAKLPESSERVWQPFMLEGKRIASLSDIHIPYHSLTALKPTLAWLKKFNPDVILLNGDTVDFYQLSRFEKDPRERSVADELAAAKQFLDYLKENFPKAKIIWKDGNHDERYQSYLRVKAPELLDVPEFRFPRLMEFIQRGIGYVTAKQLIQVGEHLTILHGHEYATPVIGPVNAARGLFLRTKACALVGHHHQSSEHTEPTVQGKMITTWSQGCLCDLHPLYMPLNKWNHGFAIITNGDSGFELENKRIINGKVM